MSSSRKLKMMRRRELPFELVVEILARVPVKDLIRFRCVCKTWRSLFQDERFYRQHMTHAPTRIVSFRLSDILLGRFSCDNSGNKAEMILQANNILNARGERLVIDASLLGHCHGLFCFCFDNRIFGVWNPSLRVLREIRKPDVREWSEMGFGYDPSSQDYKIVLLLKKQGIHSEALVFSLKSGASRMIEFRDIGMLHSRVPGTLVGENIYWHVYDAKVKVTDKFLGFDLVSETFKFYPGPSNCGKGFPEVIAGGLRGGGLCTVGVDALSGGLIVWSAQHDDKIGGGIKSWSKICILSPGILEISTSCRIHRIFVVSAITYAGLLLVLLWNKDRINTARDVLKDCMRGSLAKARVLYIPVEEIGDEGRLLRACKVITDAFVKAGLVLEKDANQSLKLHATVMNVRHRKRKDKRKKMDTFDAREIHKQFGNEDWGEYLIQEAHLSQRFVFDQSGYYRCCASIPFPGEHRD
uniref:F-box domain-containing protein n=1 Tax=Brassica oleracea var. oleracea TaxID=109376 RepID=A0A0D3BBL8_BRAOL